MDILMFNLVENISNILDKIQQSLFHVAKEKRDACIRVAKAWEEFTTTLNKGKIILAPWCDEKEVELDVKKRTEGESGTIKTLCTFSGKINLKCRKEQYALPLESLQRSGIIVVRPSNCCRHSPRKHTSSYGLILL